MPIYEYECQTCGNTFEKRQSFSDTSNAPCPEGHDDTRRLLSAPAIVFKGSGFYINDSKSKQKSNGAGKSTKSESSSTDKSTETKSETKSESKAKSEA